MPARSHNAIASSGFEILSNAFILQEFPVSEFDRSYISSSLERTIIPFCRSLTPANQISSPRAAHQLTTHFGIPQSLLLPQEQTIMSFFPFWFAAAGGMLASSSSKDDKPQTPEEKKKTDILIGAIVGSIFGFFFLVVMLICCCHRCSTWKRKISNSNTARKERRAQRKRERELEKQRKKERRQQQRDLERGQEGPVFIPLSNLKPPAQPMQAHVQATPPNFEGDGRGPARDGEIEGTSGYVSRSNTDTAAPPAYSVEDANKAKDVDPLAAIAMVGGKYIRNWGRGGR